MSHIFISYSRKDLAFVQKIVKALVRAERLRAAMSRTRSAAGCPASAEDPRQGIAMRESPVHAV